VRTLGDLVARNETDADVTAAVMADGGVKQRNGAPAPDDVFEWIETLYPRAAAEPMGEHHIEAWEWVESIEATDDAVEPCVLVLARGGGKSSTAELAVVRVGLTGRRGYIWYVRATQLQADRSLANIANLLEAEAVEIHYPEHADRRLSKYGHSKGWNASRLTTQGGLTIDAIGLDTAARGLKADELRPGLIVFDDVDAKEDSEKATAKKIRTITHSVLPAGTASTAVLAVQNLIIPDGIFSRLARVSDEPADFLQMRRVIGPVPAVYGMEVEQQEGPDGFPRAVITAGEPSWSGQSLADCQAMIDQMGLTAFRQEAQHDVKRREGALWNFDTHPIVRCTEAEVPDLVRVVVAVDPSGGGDAIGIVIVGIDRRGVCYVLADRTQLGSLGVKNWASEVVQSFDDFEASRVVAERNFGGDMVEAVILAEDETGSIPVTMVTASRGKALRAEPAAALYENGRVIHVGYLAHLESEQQGWVPGDPTSPNRLDALVWALTHLALRKRRRVAALVPGEPDAAAAKAADEVAA
jgi:hypothetical protein